MGCASSTPELTSDDKLSRTYQRAHVLSNLTQQTNKVDPMSRYEIVKKLGVGSMGSVSSVRMKAASKETASGTGDSTTAAAAAAGTGDLSHRDGHAYAMKTIRPGRLTREFIAELKNEIRAVRNLDHPNIVRFHEVYYGKEISIIMDLCSGGDVYGRMPYDEAQAAFIMKQVLDALAYMHRKGYVHLDIKCENIMFTTQDPQASVKIIDFGFAARYDSSKGELSKQLGTFDTMAPEVFGGKYTTKADLWSAGVVAFELISGKKPFAAGSPLGVIGRIASGEYNMDNKAWQKKTKASKAFVKALIEKDTEKRLGATAALKHKWLKENVPVNLSLSDSHRTHMSHMKAYGEAPTIKKLGLLMIAHKTFPEDLVKLQSHFERYDTERTGTVTVEEFKQAMLHTKQEYSDEEIMNIFRSIDMFHSGEIAYTEFIAALLDKYVNITEENIADAFERLDVSNSGYISMGDLRLVLGKDFTEDVAKEIIAQVDSKEDGKISYEEFVSAFRKKEANITKQLTLRDGP